MKYLVFLFLLILLPSGFSVAQTNLGYGDQTLSIVLDPIYPAPNTTFTASADDYALPVQGNSIKWFVDGKQLTEANNQREITLQSKSTGKDTVIELVVSLPGGTTVSAKSVVSPSYLDLIIEPQTRTPAFYKGRALPSVGSVINATAIINGGKVSANNLMYTWRLNGKALENGSVRGKSRISFQMPQGRFVTLSLEVTTLSGEVIAKKIFDLQSVEPTLAFYEVSTLYGLKERAVIGGLSLIGNSVSVRAEPYYLDLNIFNYPKILEWKVDGNQLNNNSQNPYEITLASGGLGGVSEVSFHVRDSIQLLQGVQDKFQINF